MNQVVRAYYCHDGSRRFPEEIKAVIAYASDGMCLVMFRNGWQRWVTQRYIEIESA